MAPIAVLPPEVAGKIAAGEVIERPASVVRELVDNALDAGATQITVEIASGGLQLVRVVDNGSGIPPEEVEQAFLRHATSKLTTLDDLEQLATLGFRGEALPSIAAVADVTLTTRVVPETGGVRMRVRDGVLTERGAAGAPPGTSVVVRDLFAHVPARRKFLKSVQTESGQVATLLQHYALSSPHAAFTLIVDGRRTLQTPGDGDLRSAAAEVYGADTARALLDVRSREGEATAVSGLVSPPSVSRSNRTGISFFVNRRWVQSRSLTVAVEEAYQGLLMVGRSPLAILHLSVPAQDVDVNVHPSKREVRFLHEREMFVLVQRAVRGRLVEGSPVVQSGILAGAEHSSWERGAAAAGLPSDRVLLPERMPAAGSAPDQTRQQPSPARVLPVLRVVGQLALTYIVAEGPEGMYLVDQHAAHERVRYEQAQARLAVGRADVQGLLEPVAVELTLPQMGRLTADADLLAGYGFALEPFGGRSVLVRAIPAALTGRPVAGVLRAILDDERGGTERRHRLAASLACHSAVRAGDILTPEQMRSLLRQLEDVAAPHTCPHGRPTMLHIPAAQLEREFGRRG